MKRIIINESEKKQILLKHNLLFEGTAKDQQVMMEFKNDFMSKSYGEIADGLEKMKTAPGLTSDDISQIDQAVLYLRKNNALSGTAKQLVNKKFDEYINDRPEVAKNMLCYLINKNSEYSNPKMNSFCTGNPKPEENKKVEEPSKTEVKKVEEPSKTEVNKTTNPYAPGSIANPYGTDTNVYAPGSIANPYGT